MRKIIIPIIIAVFLLTAGIVLAAKPSGTPVVTPTATEKTNNQRGSEEAEQYRSTVSKAVQKLVNSSERFQQENPGIGEQVRVIAQEQNQSIERVTESLKKIQKRNTIIRFLIGPDYSEIEKIKKEIEQNRLRIQEFNQVMNQLQNKGQEKEIQEQIQLLEWENTNLKELLRKIERSFSLFGWLVRFFQGQ